MDRQPPPPREAALEVVRHLRDAGCQALFAGGCVRDILLGRTPKDFDVATDARPETVRGLFRRTIPAGEKFGVVIVVIRGTPVEVATFRSEEGYADGRRPDRVVFTDAAGDASRRDFTINGMFLDPVADAILDTVGGREDLERRVVRAIGDPAARMREDHLRMLRAVRFTAELDFELDEPTAAAIRKQAASIERISAERIREEITGILTGAHPSRGVRLLHETGLLAHVLPEAERLQGVPQPEQYHPEGDVWVHTLLVLDHLPENPSPELAWAALLHDIAKPDTYEEAPDRIRFHGHDTLGAKMARRIGRRLKMSNRSIERIDWLVATHLKFKDLPNMRPARLRRFLSEPGFPEALDLHRADCLASHGDLSIHDFCREKLEAYASEPILPPPLVDGNDLIALGLDPGPRFKEILTAVQDEQLEDRLTDREQALAWVRERFAG